MARDHWWQIGDGLRRRNGRGSIVASGDRSRTWFPEMINELRQSWSGDLDMEELIALAQSLDRLLQDIRTKRGIRPPTILCRKCGKRGPVATPHVSVRATILAAGRFGIGAQVDVERLNRLWQRHRSQEALDLYGRPTGASDSVGCSEVDCIGHGVGRPQNPADRTDGNRPVVRFRRSLA